MPIDYKQYQEEVTTDVAKVLADAGCQPILFVGSGFSKQHARGPNWEELPRSRRRSADKLTPLVLPSNRRDNCFLCGRSGRQGARPDRRRRKMLSF